MQRCCTVLTVLSLAAGFACGQTAAPTPAHAAPQSSPAAAGANLSQLAAQAEAWLLTQQDAASGGWAVTPPGKGPVFPAITGLVLQGMLIPGEKGEENPAVAAGVKFLLSYQQPDGGIYDKVLPTYNTAISLSALTRVKNPSPRVQDAIVKAREFLKTLQYGEGAITHDGLSESARAVTKDDAFYGAWGYGNRGRPDLSNSAWVMEALHDSGLPESDPAYQRAVVFLQRCQMLERAGGEVVNDAAYAKGSNQGGFIYATSVNKDNIGIGQSFAGEIVESLSGPPGLVAYVTLAAKGADGKQVTLAREAIKTRIAERARASSDPKVKLIADQFMIAFGPGYDGKGGPAFEMRAGITDVDLFTTFVKETFADVSEPGMPVTVRAAAHWQGESRLRAYGSMTYSGFKSYLYAGLTRTDPRVTAAKDWIAHNYTLEENPGVGTDGLYYYLVVFAKAMHAMGEPTVMTIAPDGTQTSRDWAADLAARCATLQNADGSFRSVDDRWMENNTVLITAYSLVALRHAETGR